MDKTRDANVVPLNRSSRRSIGLRKAEAVLRFVTRHPKLTKAQLIAELRRAGYSPGARTSVEHLFETRFLEQANSWAAVYLTEDGHKFLELTGRL